MALPSPPTRPFRRGQIPLWGAVLLFLGGIVFLGFWTFQQTQPVANGKQTIIFWGSTSLGEDIDLLIHRFEQKNPEYDIVMSKAMARDLTGDAQRLMCAIAGEVPPDVVFFDRFAIGEWAARGAFVDLQPLLDAQDPNDPYRLELSDYYDYAVAEASYRPPGTSQPMGVFGIPCSTDIRFMYCNSDILRQAGLVDADGNPKPPKNWDELREYGQKLTLYRVPDDKKSGIERLGYAPNTGNSSLYMYAWQADGEFMNADRTKVTLNTEPVRKALKFMVEVYDDLGGVGQVKSFEEAQQFGGALDPFLLDRLAVKIDGDWSMGAIADWRPGMDFIALPAPMPQDQIDLGKPPVAWSGGYAYIIPTTSRQKDGAFKFIQYLRSWEGVSLLEQGKREQRQSEGRVYLPRIEVNQVFCDRLFTQYIDNNPSVPPPFKRAYTMFRELIPHTLIRPVTPVGQMLWTQQVRAFESAAQHGMRAQAQAAGKDEIEMSLAVMEAPVQAQLQSILNPPPPNVVSWTPYFTGYVLVILLIFAAMFITYRVHKKSHSYKLRELGAAMLFMSPWMIGFVVLVGGPILFSIVMSFTRYDVLSEARYVGTSNYRDVLSDPIFLKSLGNTAYMVIAIPMGMAIGLGIALLLDRAVRGIGLYRAGYYMPAIMPLVAASLMWIWILNPSYGLINSVLGWFLDTPPAHWIESLISLFTAEPFHFSLPLWLQDKSWSKPSLILMRLWGAGGGLIIWLAGLQSIPQQLYEAAKVDGANAWQRFRNVTIPMLSPYILFNLIIGLIGTMQIFAESYIMTVGGPDDSTLFYAYYLFKQAFQYFNMGYASALAWLLFVIVLVLTLGQLWLSKRWVHYEQA